LTECSEVSSVNQLFQRLFACIIRDWCGGWCSCL